MFFRLGNQALVSTFEAFGKLKITVRWSNKKLLTNGAVIVITRKESKQKPRIERYVPHPPW